jgi:hypothetical protein
MASWAQASGARCRGGCVPRGCVRGASPPRGHDRDGRRRQRGRGSRAVRHRLVLVTRRQHGHARSRRETYSGRDVRPWLSDRRRADRSSGPVLRRSLAVARRRDRAGSGHAPRRAVGARTPSPQHLHRPPQPVLPGGMGEITNAKQRWWNADAARDFSPDSAKPRRATRETLEF